MAYTYLPVGWTDDVTLWAERGLAHLDPDADPVAHANAHFLLGAGRLRAGGSALEQAEAELREAIRLAELHGVRDVGTLARFELGNARAERGDLAGAIAMYAESVALAEAERDLNQQVLSLNNLAYHTMLQGDAPAARGYIERALELAEQFGLAMAREYLLSTRGEIELADRRWAEAEEWVNASLREARQHHNVSHVAKSLANLGLIARGRGDLDNALSLLEEAAELSVPLTARYMQAQIDLWLAEIHLAREERVAAGEALTRAERRLAASHYDGLIRRSHALRAALSDGHPNVGEGDE
jgi:ATP/maltotriose-dependent transcriptional regulator MalT